MGGKGNTYEAPPPIDIYKSYTDFAKAVKDSLPSILDTERAARPEFAKLELADIQTNLFGADGQEGILSLQRRAGEEIAERERIQKERDLALIDEYGTRVSDTLRGLLDPDASEIARLQAQTTKNLFNEAEGVLSPERQRQADQAARASGVAGGRLFGEGTAAASVLNRENIRSGLRQQALSAAPQSFAISRQAGGDPLGFLFGSPSQALRFGGDAYTQGFNLAQVASGPQSFDSDAGVNLAMAQRQDDINFMQAQMQYDASQRSAGMDFLGSVAGATLGGAGAAKGFSKLFS